MALASAIIAASVSLVVAVLTPTLSSWRARRQAIADLFDNASNSLLVAQVARLYAANTPGVPTEKWTDEERHKFAVRIQQQGVERFIQAQDDARVALARLVPFVPEFRQLVTRQWEVREDEYQGIGAMVEARRADAIKSERLFRTRRPPRSLPR
jgi:hypothetical protein